MQVLPIMRRLVVFITFVLFLFSCTKTGDNKPNAPRQKIKKRLLTSYSGTDNAGVYKFMVYDSSGRLKQFGSQIDPEWTVFWANDTIRYVLGPVSTFNGLFMRESWIFVYDQDKRCTGVFRKSVNNYDGSAVATSNPYFNDLNDGHAALMDSLVYTTSGQLKEVWYYAGADTRGLSRFEYDSPDQPAPKAIVEYDGIPRDLSNYTYWGKTTFTYAAEDQPAYAQLWFLGLMNIWVPVTPDATAAPSYMLTVLLKKSIRHFTRDHVGDSPFSSAIYKYQYNSDSTIFNGTHDPDNFLLNRMQMQFVIKEF